MVDIESRNDIEGMNDIKAQLKAWIIDKKKIHDTSILNNTTALLDTQILKSIDVMDLIIFIEFLRDAPLHITELKPGAFHSIDAIAEHFFISERA